MTRNRSAIGSIGTLIGTVNPKMVLAAVLLLVMAVLWLRVFLRGRSGPETVQAQIPVEPSAGEQAAGGRTESKVLLQPRLLPVLAGRHDRPERDPFVFDRSQWFRPERQILDIQPQEPVSSSAGQGREILAKKIAKDLILQAVIKDPSGIPVQACVNGVVLARGGVLKLKENGEMYELKVSEIGSQHVKFEYEDMVFVVKMPSLEWLD